ncbi:reticulocyte-binding protein homolog 2a-like [Saccostrea cucullata]|uniref:reticulocyte-binding protein homolog 2a-like n=1 Tax=Saccostrea cuccullata TaxID=36930 RepID=UPI002ED581EA
MVRERKTSNRTDVLSHRAGRQQNRPGRRRNIFLITLEAKDTSKRAQVHVMSDMITDSLNQMMDEINKKSTEEDISDIQSSFELYVDGITSDDEKESAMHLLERMKNFIPKYAGMNPEKKIAILNKFVTFISTLRKNYKLSDMYILYGSMLMSMTFATEDGYNHFIDDSKKGKVNQYLMVFFYDPDILSAVGLVKDDISVSITDLSSVGHGLENEDKTSFDLKGTTADFSHLDMKDETEEEMRVLLIGKTGVGKSRTGKRLMVVDSPGFCDLTMSEEDIDRELQRCVEYTAPGLHAFILVTEIGRFTNDDQFVLQKCKEKFGDHLEEHLIILFTQCDDIEREGSSIDRFLAKGDEKLLNILKKAKYRYITLNNNAPVDQKQRKVSVLTFMVQCLMEERKGQCFTNRMYQEVEEAYQKKKKMEAEEMKRKEEEEKEKHFQEIRRQEAALKEKRDLFEKKKAEAEAARITNMKLLEEKYEKEKKEHENNIRECKEEFEREKLERIMLNLQDEYQREIRFLKKSNDQKKRNLEERLQQKEREFRQEREEMQLKLQSMMAEMRDMHKKELKQFRESYRETVSKPPSSGSGCILS